jgi:hypothetical protein
MLPNFSTNRNGPQTPSSSLQPGSFKQWTFEFYSLGLKFLVYNFPSASAYRNSSLLVVEGGEEGGHDGRFVWG